MAGSRRQALVFCVLRIVCPHTQHAIRNLCLWNGMHRLTHLIVQRLRPTTGWPLALLIFSAAVCPAIAAAEASLPLPVNLIGWAGLLGAAMGLRVAALPRGPWRWFYAPVALILTAALLLARSADVPPIGLFWHDGRALIDAVAARLAGANPALPELLTPRFVQLALPRAWQGLLAAPEAGEAGASLIIAGITLITTVSGALALGYGYAAGRHMIGWSLPLTLALGIVTIFGGAAGAGLVLGLGLLLGLGSFAGYKVRTRNWDFRSVAYSDQLHWGVLGWSVGLVGSALMLSLLIPTSLPLLSGGIGGGAGAGDLPSGLAAIEDRVARGNPSQPVDPGLSELPVVALGTTLNAAPPEQLALRVRLTQPLPPSPYPHYWRARVLNIYNGRNWWADARVGPQINAGTTPATPAGIIRQEFELADADQQLLIALPDALHIDIPVRWEYLPDGTPAAITGEPPGGRYTVLSRPQEFAAPAIDAFGVASYDQTSLALPPDLPLRVTDLARSITAGATDPYAQALAIESYLRGLPYAYEVQPIPAAGDAVDQFLFAMRRGYCTYYASAMAVMARSLGIPARLAVGYATGTYDEALGAYLVYAADAHAWPELLIDGRWLPFEPTPVQPLPLRTTDDAQPLPVPVPQPDPAEVAQDRPLQIVFGSLIIGLVALLAAAGWFFRDAGRLSPPEQAQRQLERFGARAGVSWPPGVTLHEYGQLLSARGLADSALIAEVVQLIEQARYSDRPLDTRQRQQLRADMRILRSN
jgi:transglutaminase-like putative cysteine protease